MPDLSTQRTYRSRVRSDLIQSRVIVQETDLCVYAPAMVDDIVKDAVIQQRAFLEAYIRRHPVFMRSLEPLHLDPLAPQIVQAMLTAGHAAAVGPMAAVAGAIAEQVGQTVLTQMDEVIVENGGDIFIRSDKPLTVGLYAGASPLSMAVGLKIEAARHALGVCTSSGTIGHSLSFGDADAVCVVSSSCALADAAATAIANTVRTGMDIQEALSRGRQIKGVDGIVAIAGDQVGAWGAVELVRL